MKNEFQDVQNKQQEIISRDINILQSNLTATTKNLANKIVHIDQKLNSTQVKQLKLTSDLRDHGHGNKQRIDQLTSQIENFTSDLKLIDQQIETVQQKQNELSRLGEGNDKKINVLWTNLTDEIHLLDEKLNSTQEKQLELTSDVRNHGHGNKLRIEQLTSQITNFESDWESFDQKVETVLQKQTEISSQMNRTNSGKSFETSKSMYRKKEQSITTFQRCQR